MPGFCLKKNHPFSLSVFKMNDTVDFEDKHFCGYQTIIFHSNSIILIIICSVLENCIFSTMFYMWFKVKRLC